MNWSAIAFDWNQVRAFLATVEEGSLSAAARALGQTQPTLSRQITALESALGVTLFERGARASEPTRAALELLEHVRAMGEAAQRVSLVASGQAMAIEGEVSISSTDVMSATILPPIIARIHAAAPKVQLRMIASNALSDLARREADIAIRHARPEQPDLIARKVADIDAVFMARQDLLDRFGHPQNAKDLSRLPFVGFGRDNDIINYLSALGIPLSADNFPITTDNGMTFLALVREGLGVGILTRDIAERSHDLIRICPDIDPIPVPIWLVTHRELRSSQRLRVVFDLLAEELATAIRSS